MKVPGVGSRADILHEIVFLLTFQPSGFFCFQTVISLISLQQELRNRHGMASEA